MLRLSKLLLFVSLVLFAAPNAFSRSFVDYGPASSFLDVDVQLLIGGATVTQDYMDVFPEIRELNSSMRSSAGFGFRGVFGLRDYLGIGTEANVLRSNYRMDMAVANDDNTSVSNVFLRNRTYYLNIPVFLSFRFNIGGTIRWIVDAGMYYAYGFAGSQKQVFYNTAVNDLGQLVSTNISAKPSYFNSDETFINANRRGDLGLHLGTGLTFAHRYSIGARFEYGFKNISYTSGIKTPSVHNISLRVSFGYRL